MNRLARALHVCRRESLHPAPINRRRTSMSRKPFLIAALTLALPLAALAQAGPYKVLQTVKVGGDGGMDYVTADSANRTLYVARSGAAGHIGVFNLDTFAQLGDIPNT